MAHTKSQYAELQDIVTDEPLRNALLGFPARWLNAQSALNKERLGGMVAFEIILTILTAGIGTAANAAAKSKQLVKASETLQKASKLLRRKRLNTQGRVDLKPDSKASTPTNLDTQVDTKKLALEDKPKVEIKTGPTSVIKEQFGSNSAKWTVDAHGRPISVEAVLDNTYSSKRGKAETNLQRKVGDEARLPGDEGGHLIGHRFMSDQGVKNLFPQNMNFNRSAYKTMENDWADWTEAGFEVRLKVQLDPPGAQRPDNVISEYEVFDQETGDLAFKRRHEFNDTAGEQFKRVSKNDMAFYKGN